VRAITPKDKLLEFKSEDGWAPLCEFLGASVPEGAYPHVNETNNFIRIQKILWCISFGKYVAKRALPVVVAAGAFYFWQRRV
jgi:Sulfotransferase domain